MDPNLAALLDECADLGVPVEFSAMTDACPLCRVFNGQRFDPREAPDIPVPGCQRDICRCDYLPVAD